jgi:inner membrane protein
MASLGHIAVGMAASRVHDRTRDLHWLSALSWAALSMLPDADIVGLPLGVAYAAPWGHRGATHSMMFAVAVGFGIGVAAWSRRSRAPLVTWLLATAVLASHGLLDTLTDGGMGCALLWPFDRTRYFAPWRPIPVSPIGLDYLSPYGLMVAITEFVVFAPLFVYALMPRRRT